MKEKDEKGNLENAKHDKNILNGFKENYEQNSSKGRSETINYNYIIIKEEDMSAYESDNEEGKTSCAYVVEYNKESAKRKNELMANRKPEPPINEGKNNPTLGEDNNQSKKVKGSAFPGNGGQRISKYKKRVTFSNTCEATKP